MSRAEPRENRVCLHASIIFAPPEPHMEKCLHIYVETRLKTNAKVESGRALVYAEYGYGSLAQLAEGIFSELTEVPGRYEYTKY